MKKAVNIYFLFYWGALILIAVSLPLSKYTLSIAIILLSAGWIFSGHFRELSMLSGQQSTVLIIAGFFIINLIWLLNTSDFVFGLRHLKIKLPLLIFPLIMATSPALKEELVKRILLFFVAAVVVSTLISGFYFFYESSRLFADIRQYSLFISHIRFSLMIVFSVCILWYYGFYLAAPVNHRIAVIIVIVWLVFYIFLLKTLTGLILLPLMVLILSVITAYRLPVRPRRLLLSAIFIGILVCVLFFYFGFNRFKARNSAYNHQPVTHTVNGRPYEKPYCTQYENGNLVWHFVNEQELKQAWAGRSRIDYHGTDGRQQDLRFTLIRYLSSKALTKDSAGLSKLTDNDIRNIEAGITNVIFENRFSLYARLYEVLWQFEQYPRVEIPEGHSVTMRLFYFNAGWSIAKRNFLTGTGTGDLQHAFDDYYNTHYPQLKTSSRLRAQNQFLTFLISFGIVGFVLVVASFIFPVVLSGQYRNVLFICFLIIIFFSMLYEDTLETHTGVSFFSFFYTLFIYGRNRN